MLEIQRSILQKQNEILSRLVKLENNQSYHQHQMYSFDEKDYSFEVDDQPPMFIPPPPSHPAPVSTGTPLWHPPTAHPHQRARHQALVPPDNLALAPTHPSPRHVPPAHPSLGRLPPAQVHPPSQPLPTSPPSIQGQNEHTRPPLRQLQPSSLPNNIAHRKKIRPPSQPPLPSSAVDASTLLPVDAVIRKNPKLLCESKLPTLAQKLAKEAYFSEAVMVQCTVAGERDLPGLPEHELNQLKRKLLSLFPQYWWSPYEFEAQWKHAEELIGQACKRLRTNSRKLL